MVVMVLFIVLMVLIGVIVVSLVLEMVPAVLAKRITEQLRIPTIGIGAGPDCDGQVLVLHDLIGLSRRSPKFSKQYAQVGTDIVSAISAFNADVEAGRFPGPEHGF
ncbi:hypothetical protein EBR96_08460 [bacterium]|nr:hypothetical protein [bacterium]